MNRIVLIGNGFDLAHGLPTKYNDFIADYWCFVISQLRHPSNIKHEDNLCQINLNDDNHTEFASLFNDYGLIENPMLITQLPNLKIEYKNHLFETICSIYNIEKWVDIEEVYYRLLKEIYEKKTTIYTSPKELNDELDELQKNLIIHLSNIQDEKINSDLKNNEIERKILEPFSINDISIRGKDAFSQFITKRFDDAMDEQTARRFLYKYEKNSFTDWSDIQEYISQAKESKVGEHAYHQQKIMNRNYAWVPSFFLLPEEILFLNFNYTNTANLYVPQNSDFRVNYIHGKLKDAANPIIFGYGDEMDEKYKEIENLNNNDYLKNIKSIRYLETDNYRRLLSYIESAPYQIYIMGHSCGNSDRTLLNTLFEHKNCISIKPYYHKKDDGTDNYIDIVQNISRDFNDMTLMRDRVVNKTYCEPLSQNKTE